MTTASLLSPLALFLVTLRNISRLRGDAWRTVHRHRDRLAEGTTHGSPGTMRVGALLVVLRVTTIETCLGSGDHFDRLSHFASVCFNKSGGGGLASTISSSLSHLSISSLSYFLSESSPYQSGAKQPPHCGLTLESHAPQKQSRWSTLGQSQTPILFVITIYHVQEVYMRFTTSTSANYCLSNVF